MIMFRFCSICILSIAIISSSCSQSNESQIDKNTFILVYARILVINELSIPKEQQNKLITDLFQQYKVKIKDVQNTIEYYQENPNLWSDMLEKINEQIIELHKNKYTGKELKN